MARPETKGISSKDRDNINDITKRFVKLMLAGDTSSLAKLYTADGVLMPPNHPTVRGRSAVAEFLATFPKLTRFSAKNDEIDGREDLAYVRGSFEMTMQLESGESVDDRGTYLEIRKRQADGAWLIALDTFSSDIEH